MIMGECSSIIKYIINELDYNLVEQRVLQAVKYKVPQKRKRVILIAVKKEYQGKAQYHWPEPYYRIMNLRDAFYPGELYSIEVPASKGLAYSGNKRKVLELVPMGGYWKDLPIDIQKNYMGKSIIPAAERREWLKDCR